MAREVEKKEIVIPDFILESWNNILKPLKSLLKVEKSVILRWEDPFVDMVVPTDYELFPSNYRVTIGSLIGDFLSRGQDVLKISDIRAEKEWETFSVWEEGVRAVLGMPLRWSDGTIYGMMGVTDNKAREFTPENESIMEQFRRLVEGHLSLLLAQKKLEEQAVAGILTVCAHCRKVKAPDGEWMSLEEYLKKKTGIQYSHGICPECMDKDFPGYSAPCMHELCK